MVVLCAVAGASDGDDDLAPGVACFERPHGLGDLAQRVGPADARGELAGSWRPPSRPHTTFPQTRRYGSSPARPATTNGPRATDQPISTLASNGVVGMFGLPE